jgi:UDP-N-acetylglucosamine:LPS N-acetylglucosamine transferase
LSQRISKPVQVLAVSSGGGHWVQLLRLRPAFDGCEVTYATVQASYAAQVPEAKFYPFTDATRWSRWNLVKMVLEVTWIVLRTRPDVVISTGAAPGVVALRIGKILGAKTVWLDSIANVEAMSMSGRKVGRFADLWLTQWPEVARKEGCAFKGAVL